jgi:hypothetical protein
MSLSSSDQGPSILQAQRTLGGTYSNRNKCVCHGRDRCHAAQG